MTRFLFISDTHSGACPAGYVQQRPYHDRLPELLDALSDWIRRDEHIDFVLHGGDIIEQATVGDIESAVRDFALPVPFYLCLGNHDVMAEGAIDLWRDHAPSFFKGPGVEYTVETPDCLIHVVPTQWNTRAYFWDPKNLMDPHFLPSQSRFIEDALEEKRQLPHIICTHSDIIPVPDEQTGLKNVSPRPPSALTADISGLAWRFSHLKCVLSGHSHINMNVRVASTHFVTVSAFSESPFDFKLVEVERNRISMTTVNLFNFISFRADYDFNRSFVQGRPMDRSFELTW